jgi:hypothetical protein
MAAPSSAITRFDLSLAYQEFDMLANQQKFIGLKVLPPIGVSQEASDFLKLDVASFLTKREDTRRAPYGGYSRDTFAWTKESYACEEHGVEEVADDALVEKYGDIVRMEQLAVARAVNRILQTLEYDIATAVFNTTTWTGSTLTADIDTANTANGITTSGNKWSDRANSDPLADIDYAAFYVKANCGMAPNTVVMTDIDFRNCIRSTRLEGLLKYDAVQVLTAMAGTGPRATEVRNDAAAALAAAFGVEQVLIGQGFQNTADKGQTAAFGRFWTAGRVMVCHSSDDGMSGDLQASVPSIGRTIFSTKNGEPLPGSDDAGFGSLLFDEYREEQVRGSVFRPRNKRQVKMLHTTAGFLLTGAQ